MKDTAKKLIKFIIIYLITSAMYIGVCITFETPKYYEGSEVSAFYNIFRIIMGVPKVDYGYKGGISPKFLIEIIIKLILAVILSVYLIIDSIKNKKTKITKTKNFLFIIEKVIINMLLIFVYLIFLYVTYAEIHWIR